MRNAGLHVGLLALAATVMVPGLVVAEVPESPTFHKDIEPILQRSCQVCHRPDNMAPMSLLSYQETRPWARSIKNKVEAREMPPWHIDPKVGVQGFKNDRSLSKDEIVALSSEVLRSDINARPWRSPGHGDGLCSRPAWSSTPPR